MAVRFASCHNLQYFIATYRAPIPLYFRWCASMEQQCAMGLAENAWLHALTKEHRHSTTNCSPCADALVPSHALASRRLFIRASPLILACPHECSFTRSLLVHTPSLPKQHLRSATNDLCKQRMNIEDDSPRSKAHASHAIAACPSYNPLNPHLLPIQDCCA